MRKEFGIEDIFRGKSAPERMSGMLSEADAEQELETLLARPENAFLTQVPANYEQIEAAESAISALAFAQRRIHERLESTLSVKRAVQGHVEAVRTNAETIVSVINEVLAHAEQIGEGADGRVVIDTRGEHGLNPEVCCKFALVETLKRGRNSMIEEIEMQSAFYEAAASYADIRIGVPEPYYEVDTGNIQMIAMEKLYARSVDDVLRGFGTLPTNFDVDVFCDALRSFIDAMHTQGLYHRDLHYGNIMVTQPSGSVSEGEERPLGYVIDFGLSGYAQESMEPYKKENAGIVFTYDDDYGRIESVRKDLKGLQSRMSLQR